MVRIVKNIRLCLILVFLISCKVLAQAITIPGKTVTGQEVWRGTIVIEGDVVIAPAGRLIIEEGSSVLFRANTDRMKSGRDKTRSELIVYGELQAKGSINNKIRFSSAQSAPRMQDWFGVSILSPDKVSILDYVLIEFAYNGLVIKKSNPQISNSQIQFNFNAGIVTEVESAPKINGNIISENDYAGIICNTGARPVFSDNMIAQNQIGMIIFGAAQPNLGSLTRDANYNIGRNAFVNNREYNLHNHSTQNILAENNSWGETELSKIAKTIFDSEDDRKHGKISYSPILGSGINLEEKILLAQASEQISAPAANNTTRQVTNPSAQNQTQNTRNAASERNQQTTATAEQKPVSDLDSALAKTTTELPQRLVVDATPKIEEKPIIASDQQVNDSGESGKVSGAPAEQDIDYNLVFLDAFLDKSCEIINKITPVVRDPQRGLGEHGRIIVRVVVDRSGKVETATVLRGLNPYYDSIAQEAAKKFEFKPGTIAKKPVRFATSLFFEF
jgi:TonB family protein